MTVLMIRSTINEKHVTDVESAVERVFAALDERKPTNVRYASCKLSDGVTYVVFLEIADGTENPLPTIPAFLDFQQRLPGWVTEPPVAEQATVVGSYRLFG